MRNNISNSYDPRRIQREDAIIRELSQRLKVDDADVMACWSFIYIGCVSSQGIAYLQRALKCLQTHHEQMAEELFAEWSDTQPDRVTVEFLGQSASCSADALMNFIAAILAALPPPPPKLSIWQKLKSIFGLS